MSRIWFSKDLETVATFWRVMRRDGVTLGFTTHDRNLWFDGIVHNASPGMVPSAIRKSADLSADSAEVEGSLSSDAIATSDLSIGRFDGAVIVIGLVDWESGAREFLYRGRIDTVSQENGSFTAQLESRKEELRKDPNPRTSPACRAQFCGPGCNLNPERYTHEVVLEAADISANALNFAGLADPANFICGELRWLDGPLAGLTMGISGRNISGWLVPDTPIDIVIPAGTCARLREGCDRTLESCATRFGNAINFRGEPFLPGNDLLTRYPSP